MLLFGNKRKPSVRILDRRRVEKGLFPREHLLFQVEGGAGKLRWVWWESEQYFNTPAAQSRAVHRHGGAV